MRRPGLSDRGYPACTLLAWSSVMLVAATAHSAPPAASFGDPESPPPVATTPDPPDTPPLPAPDEPAPEPISPTPPQAAEPHAALDDEPDAPTGPHAAPPTEITANGTESTESSESSERLRRLGSSAHADRVVLLPTAYTHPAGTFYVSDYDLVVLQTGYAFTDSTQLSATFTPPIEEELLVPLDLSLKVSSGQGSRVRVAGIGSATGILGLDEGPALVGRASGTVQLCFDDACRSSVTTAATAVLVGMVVFMGGTGAEVRVFDWLSLLAEADIALPLGLEPARAKGLLFAGGVRFPNRSWALDLTVAGAPSAFDGTGAAPVPLLAYTYRWMPARYRHATP